ncbi:MAG: methionyl-tRNA formyltransferase [Clostridia bacterium]|nr:methionyl-tRNA formyltransferase [Clostridia bacterium]
MRIAFMGTPEFAVPSLAALLDAGRQVVGVFCQPDRPKGRGKSLAAPPVKVLAQERGVPVFQFDRLRAPEGIEALRALKPDLVVTAAFGQILSQTLLDIPPLGTVNVHASLLPAYRGPAPINWCIMLGETVTGITTMLTDAGVDTGDMLLRQPVDILPGETAGELSERLAPIGASLLLRTLDAMERGDCPRAPQDHDAATRHPMLRKETGRIDWSAPAKRIVDLIRGVDPWPGAFTGAYKIWRAEALDVPVSEPPGTVLCANPKDGLVIATGQGGLRVWVLQAPGAKRMPAADYLRGHSMEVGKRFGGEVEA